jgi:hypothetical protein
MAQDPFEMPDSCEVGEEIANGVAARLGSMSTRPDAAEASTNDDDLIDWDVKIDTPPRRPSRQILARFVDGGRRELPPMDDARG